MRGCLFTLLISLVVSVTPGDVTAEEFCFYHEDVLGTSCELRVHAAAGAEARRAEQAVLAEIDRLEEIFSHYKPNSELARFVRLSVGRSAALSAELSGLLQRSQDWYQQSGGAYNPAAEVFSERWRRAVKEQQLPGEQDLVELVSQASAQHVRAESDTHCWTRTSSTPLTFNAMAKGTILDIVCRHVMAGQFAVDGLMLNLGGDIRIAGSCGGHVEIANPRRDAIGAAPIWQGVLENCGIATSGGSERRFEVGDQRFSHLLDPRSGWPVEHIQSASVIAADAETADVLATICSVLSVAQGLRFIDEIPGASCLLVDAEGRVWRSTGWPDNELAAGHALLTNLPDEKKSPHKLEVKFEIARPGQGGRYRRPYVAVWVEDKDGFPVKTLSLFLMVDNPGPRWHRDLRRWYAADQVRLLVDDTKLIGTVSKPTRNPGQYTVAWDGTDDAGELLPDGEYTLYLESAREHGTYQLMKQTIRIGGPVWRHELKGNAEISSASVSYEKNNKP